MTEKIAILGGGIAALTAAYFLTEPPDWQDRYDITLYSLGWRLGGKGASGRDPDNHEAGIEHGLHMWLGVYENAFNLMWRAYQALDRPPDAPFPTVQSAFTPINTYVIKEPDVAKLWVTEFPEKGGFPGIPIDPRDPDSIPDHAPLWHQVLAVLDWLTGRQGDLLDAAARPANVSSPAPSDPPGWWGHLTATLERDIEYEAEAVARQALDHALDLARRLAPDPAQHTVTHHHILAGLLRWFRDWLRKIIQALKNIGTALRRLFILFDLGLTILIGIVQDGLLTHGFPSIDRYDLRAWLAKHGALPLVLDSALLKALYDLLFAYEEGDPNRPNIVAGSTLEGILKMVTLYKGAPLWEMNAPTGDITIAPLYLVLKQRGVKFKFFRRVTSLALNDDQTAIARIDMARQVDVKDGAEYAPLIDVKGLPCWPDRPLYEQLVQGEALQASGANLESRWADWQPVGQEALHAGQDFDRVILGIPVPVLPEICAELIDHNAHWRAMTNAMGSTPTQSLQIWLKPDLPGLGWTLPPPLYSLPVYTFSSWADFSQVIPWETWEDGTVGDLSYLVGVLKNDRRQLPPPSDHEYPTRENERARQNALDVLNTQTAPIWPAIQAPDGLDWSQVVDIHSQANVDPTERYVLSLAGTTDLRMKTDQTGFSNLLVTGAWTWNILNVTSMEAAVVSGKLCAQAISGHPVKILGLSQQG